MPRETEAGASMADTETNVKQLLKDFAEKLPRFPDGRIDYSTSDRAPVLTCFVKFADKLLLLKRSDRVRTHRGKWNTVAGYIDEPKPIREKALEELSEEIGVSEKDVRQFKMGRPYDFFDPDSKKTWLVHPMMVELKQRPKIKLDWEHTEFTWIFPKELADYDTVPKLEESLKRVL
ncbi:MAG: NUDIX domain-containing protein [Candidatus Binatia bacterium]